MTSDTGLEKRAMRLIKNLRAYGTPMKRTLTPQHVREMNNIVNLSPRAASGALSPTNMAAYMANNKAQLPAYFANSRFGNSASDFMHRTWDKAMRAHGRASRQLNDYMAGINNGTINPLSPTAVRRINQLQGRLKGLDNSLNAASTLNSVIGI